MSYWKFMMAVIAVLATIGTVRGAVATWSWSHPVATAPGTVPNSLANSAANAFCTAASICGIVNRGGPVRVES